MTNRVNQRLWWGLALAVSVVSLMFSLFAFGRIRTSVEKIERSSKNLAELKKCKERLDSVGGYIERYRKESGDVGLLTKLAVETFGSGNVMDADDVRDASSDDWLFVSKSLTFSDAEIASVLNYASAIEEKTTWRLHKLSINSSSRSEGRGQCEIVMRRAEKIGH